VASFLRGSLGGVVRKSIGFLAAIDRPDSNGSGLSVGM